MIIHITMTSAGHFKIKDEKQCEIFYNQWANEVKPIIYVTVDGWEMELVRSCIEAVAVYRPE